MSVVEYRPEQQLAARPLPIGRFVAAELVDAYKVRYVRTPAGARRYGVPIGFPIPVGRKVKPKKGRRRGRKEKPTAAPTRTPGGSSSETTTRSRGGSTERDTRPATEQRTAPVGGRDTRPAPQRTPAPDRAPQQRDDRDDVAVRYRDTAREAVDNPDDAERVRQIRDQIATDLARDFPDTSQRDRDLAAEMIMRDALTSSDTDDSYSPPGRGSRLAVAALARKQRAATDTRTVDEQIADARDRVGDPQLFGQNPNDPSLLDLASDGGPGEHTLRQLEAVRDAGAAISAEADRRLADRQARADALRERMLGLRQKVDADARQFNQDVRRAWREEMGGDPPEGLVETLAADPDVQASDFPGAPDGTAEFLDRHRGRAAELREQRSQVARQMQQMIQLQRAAGQDRADVLREVLLEQRPMGPRQGRGIDYDLDGNLDADRAASVTEAISVAQESFPSDWIDALNAVPKKLSVTSTSARANYSLGPHRVDGGSYRDPDRRADVMLHELSHAMAASNNHLERAEWGFLFQRVTRSGTPGNRTFDSKSDIYEGTFERGYRDDLFQHYSGKRYVDYGVGSHEVLSTGMEDLLGRGTARGRYVDPDFEHWLLGTLALL